MSLSIVLISCRANDLSPQRAVRDKPRVWANYTPPRIPKEKGFCQIHGGLSNGSPPDRFSFRFPLIEVRRASLVSFNRWPNAQERVPIEVV